MRIVLNDILDAKGVNEPLREAVKVLIEQNNGLQSRLEAAEKDVALKERVIDALGSELNAVVNERDAMRAMLMAALDVLEEVKGNINPEQGYADELEADVEHLRRLAGQHPGIAVSGIRRCLPHQ